MRWLNIARFVVPLVLAGASLAIAVPPPAEQWAADCENPSYASDQLVCATPSLRALDLALAALAGVEPAGLQDQADWFRGSRRCAFEAEHAACLEAAYCARFALLERAGAHWPPDCVADGDDFTPVRQISRDGFAKNARAAHRLDGQTIALAGFVDHGNLYGNDDVRGLLGALWSGEGPDADHWRFDLKARADDATGRSFAVVVPDGPVRDDLLRVFAADAAAQRPTRVHVRGVLRTFDAPANTKRLIGLRLDVRSASDVRVGRP